MLFCIRANLDNIDEIFVTLDSHHKEHIAHACSWNSKIDGTGETPQYFQQISYNDIINNKWFPRDPSMKVS